MSNAAHPNMWPVAGEAVVINPVDEKKVAQAPVADADPAAPASPWANPIDRLQAHTAPKEEPKQAESRKAARQTRADQVIEHLRANGPTGGARICAALGIPASTGLTPFISSALSSGKIRREGKLYFLPEQRVQNTDAAPFAALTREPPPTTAAKPTPEATAQDKRMPVASASIAQQASRQPDFSLSSGEVLLIGWPDGAVTVQRGGVFIELTAHEAKLFRVFVELRS